MMENGMERANTRIHFLAQEQEGFEMFNVLFKNTLANKSTTRGLLPWLIINNNMSGVLTLV